jgi:hypothetical protein
MVPLGGTNSSRRPARELASPAGRRVAAEKLGDPGDLLSGG